MSTDQKKQWVTKGKKPSRENKSPTADDVKVALAAFDEKSKDKTRWLVLCQGNKTTSTLPAELQQDAAFFVVDRNPKLSPNLVMDIRDLRLLPGESFDGVIWCRTPPALIQSSKVRAELQRLIKKGGAWYFTTKFSEHSDDSTALHQLRYSETIRRKSPPGDHFVILNKAHLSVPEQHRGKFRTFIRSLRDTSRKFKELMAELKDVLSAEEIKHFQEVEDRLQRKKFIDTFSMEPEQFGSSSPVEEAT